MEFDLAIAGSGAAGLSAALIARSKGLNPIVVEKTGLIGGTTCYSGGVIWAPNSAQNQARNAALGQVDSIDKAEEYLDAIVATPHEREARRIYLERSAEAFAYLESITQPLFYVRESNSPDYYPDAPGASQTGRAMTPISCDGRKLGKHFVDLRPPLPELCLFGRQMLELKDVYHLLNAKRSLKSAFHAAGLFLRDARDRVFYRSYGRGTHLANGNALIANLYKHVLKQGIPVLRHTALVDLVRDGNRVTGIVVEREGVRETIVAHRGVVLATGGFSWDRERRREAMPDVAFGHSATSPEGTGDGIAIALENGARMDTANVDKAFWTPVSVMLRRDGSTARYPHLMADRAKPGLIAVNKHGRRFCNEAENYHDFVRLMLGSQSNEDQQPVHLVCDADFLRKYAFGAVPPLAYERRQAIRSGYLIEARSVDELARRTGVPADALAETIATVNRDSASGIDTEFAKGSTAYNRYLGDANAGSNPCFGPIAKGPFYAIRVHAGDIGTTSGLSANGDSQVLDTHGEPIEGLYACGNDRNSIMAGYYPAGGITIGPALTSSYLAVTHAAKGRPAS